MNTYHPGDIEPEKGHDGSDGFDSPHAFDDPAMPGEPAADDVFGREDGHDIKYKTLSWPIVSMLMIAEIVSNGTLSLPSSLAAVGAVPGIILILFLGSLATYTSWALIQFKLRHPEVHNMGDAGYILFGPLGREIFAAGTIIFAIFGTGSQLLAGQLALNVLSEGKLCLLLYTGIIAIAVTAGSFARTLDQLGLLGVLATFCIFVAGLVGMIGAGVSPIAPGDISVAISSNFTDAFLAVTNPVFAFAGHFMFFVLISEMARPQDAMKAAWVLQIFCTSFYIVFAMVTYWYIGEGVQSPSFLSLSPVWSKAAFGIALPNFIIAGCLYSHTAAKLVFVRLFRHGRHLHSHTALGWGTWTVLIVVANGLAFVLAVGIPIFNYIVGLTASLFAAWYTYGIAGAFWLHDAYHDKGGVRGWARNPGLTLLNVVTFLIGLFICVAGLYSTIEGIKVAYATGAVTQPFSCSA